MELLALATGGRNEALLDLTWSRCDFHRGLIDLRNPEIVRPHKGRAIVPMNRTIRAALTEARDGALSDHVIEWAGERYSQRQKRNQGDGASGRYSENFGVAAHLPTLRGRSHGRSGNLDGGHFAISRP